MNAPRECLLELAAGQAAPEGMEILRVLGTNQRPTGSGGNYEVTFIVAARAAVVREGTQQP